MITTISGCAFFQNNHKYSKNNLPRVAARNIPGDTSSKWRYLATSDDGQLIIEINDQSISPSKSLDVFDYQDRKTVIEPSKFTAYTQNQPHYKYLISSWQIDCKKKQYIIKDTTLYNDAGNQLKYYDYHNNNRIHFVKFADGSIAQLQYNYICLNQNRTLGY